MVTDEKRTRNLQMKIVGLNYQTENYFKVIHISYLVHVLQLNVDHEQKKYIPIYIAYIKYAHTQDRTGFFTCMYLNSASK